MQYVDGVVIAVPTATREAYRAYAHRMGALFKEYGALAVVDCWGDDVPQGRLTSFPLAVRCEADETVVFSWVTWTSRQARDEAWRRLETEPRLRPGTSPMPFDGRRMIVGGFEVISAL
jgi:uncharacterized protein YbaA (DUF1428 family)